ncbi:hypothetical protein ACROYT_G036325 [Oculina patagonica]
MANRFRQFRLLLWKNFLLQKRRPIGTAFEIGIPIVVMGILMLVPLTAPNARQDHCFSSFKTEDIDYANMDDQGLPTRIAFYPETKTVMELMAKVENMTGLTAVSRSVTTGKKWASGAAMAVEVTENRDKYRGAIEFYIEEENKLPKQVRYAIRLDGYWSTASTYPVFASDGPTNWNQYDSDFLALQYVLDMAIIQTQSNSENLIPVKTHQFPYPSYTTDYAMDIITLMMPLLVMLGLMYSAMTIIKELVFEKQNRLKESMKMMGLANWIHWCAWFTKNLLFLLISGVLLVIVLKVLIFKYSDVTVIFVLLLLYIIASILFCFCISVFFSRPVLGMLLGALIWIASLVPYFVFWDNKKYRALTRSQKAGACLLPNTCLGIAAKLFAQFETLRVGISWKGVSGFPSPDENFNLAWVFCMLLAQCAIYATITWYVEAVFPGEFGIPKPFYFPCLPSYWTGHPHHKLKRCMDQEMNVVLVENVNGVPQDENDGEVHADVEEEPNLPVGVSIQGLRKVFEGSTGSKVAVDELSLNIFKGQITALLGHNGAGKTTTISMLTGLYPPSSGTAHINGNSIITDMDAIRESLGLCPQHNVLFDRLTVKEHLEFFINLKGKFGPDALSEVNGMISDINLTDKTNTQSSKLSGGMKRKLSCAIALIGGSEIVFLDEPTSGMDPYARRGTWDLLLKHKAGRTIILTTHFMDEADLLGDRIAIMADGQLRCCGSSLFLKSRYGVGYHLTLVKKESYDQEAIANLVKQHVPTAEIISSVGAEIQFVLSSESSQNFEALFFELENKMEQYGITSFGVSVTTLEEVFMKVGEGAEKTLQDLAVDQEHHSHATATNISAPGADQHSIGELKAGLSLKWQQYKAMVVKRFLNSKREKKLVLTQIILPLLMVLLGLLLIKTLQEPNKNEPPRVLRLSNLSIKGLPNTGFYADFRHNATPSTKKKLFDVANEYLKDVKVDLKDIASDVNTIRTGNQGDKILVKGKKFEYKDETEMNECCNYEFLILNAKCQNAVVTEKLTAELCKQNKKFGYNFCPNCLRSKDSSGRGCYDTVSCDDTNLNDTSTYFMEYVLEDSNAADYFNKHVVGFSFIDDPDNSANMDTTLWYSNAGLHTLPDSLSALLNLMLVYKTGDDSYNIETTNYPLPLNKQEQDQRNADDMSSFFMALLLAFAVAFLAASFVPFLVKERSSKAKHLQFVSGVDAVSFWLATYSWDFINYLFPMLGIIIMFAAFQVDSLKEDLGVIVLLLLLLGLCMLPFVYLMSFMFKSPLVAYAMTVFVMSVVSLGLLIAVTILKGSLDTDSADTVHYISLFFPTYSLAASIMDISQNNIIRKYCKETPFSHCPKTSASLAWDRPGVGQATLYMFLEAIVLFVFIILIEMNFFVKARVMLSSAAFNNLRKQSEDEDVYNERMRINNQDNSEIQTQAVVLKDLTKVYRGAHITAVDHLCLGIPRGECFGLLGINGAGKTTTFSMLTGDLSITEGTAFLDGFNIQTNLKEVQQRIGYCPQFDALLERLTGREMLTMYARLRGVPDDKIKGIVTDAIKLLNLEKWADSLCGNYSGGNRRKLSTAIALVGNPPIVFLDEPTTGMDPVARRFLWNTLTGVMKGGRSIVLTSHSMEECEALCTRLAIMVNGQFKCLGSTQHLKSRFGTGYTLMVKVGSVAPENGQSTVVLVNPEVQVTSDGVQPPVPPSSGHTPVQLQAPSNVTVPQVNPDPVGMVMQFVANTFAGAMLMDSHSGILHYQINTEGLSWSYIFGQLERNRAALNIVDYSVSQTTLEQVFINFAKEQHAEDRTLKKKKCLCFSCC